MNRLAQVLALCLVLVAVVSLVVAADDKPAAVAKAKAKARPAAPKQPPDDPKLPRVLILGDSISIGYTPFVRELMAGKANVHRPNENCQSARHGVAKVDAWVGKGPWAVIHFNFGLHDLKYIDGKGTLTDVSKGKQQVPLDEYEQDLRKIVERLKQTNAKLIWCATTPVPKGAKGRVPGDEVKYNEVAAKVMKDMGVEINDLYTFANERLDKIQLPANVHFTKDGSKELAKVCVEAIEKQLK
ncbi:MAG: GDSL-like Lipase/Acylhydrolase [Planctomycetes bacterium ADurb.Bin126]|nr:MAG: GDSL-like Lipase/Acylhydrolase [Planctomycetes bacterium ADurb.Bin126]HOD83058.1 SGNH/GDSL hydrolase family protein [Phycisphaerae bacterium]HQL74211.1 SGNH/GDSL hydrolase family protein [Phycisphaerae bacterium]